MVWHASVTMAELITEKKKKRYNKKLCLDRCLRPDVQS